MSVVRQIVARNLARVRERMAEAALGCGRDPSDIALVAVVKYVDLPAVEAVIAAGCRELGESRPQQLWRKADALPGDRVHWHLVGHLQRNKIAQTLPYVTLIHSVDSIRLAKAIDERAAEIGRTVPVLLEVNISGDEAKHGFAPDELEPRLAELGELHHIAVRGLMAMAALVGGPQRARRDFAMLRELRDKMAAVAPQNIRLDDLSMGMSSDFEEAIREGATIVRIGSALFAGLENDER